MNMRGVRELNKLFFIEFSYKPHQSRSKGLKSDFFFVSLIISSLIALY